MYYFLWGIVQVCLNMYGAQRGLKLLGLNLAVLHVFIEPYRYFACSVCFTIYSAQSYLASL